VKASRVPHNCRKEQEDELAVEAPMAWAREGGHDGRFYSPRTGRGEA
jgi:hypothetical protein